MSKYILKNTPIVKKISMELILNMAKSKTKNSQIGYYTKLQ